MPSIWPAQLDKNPHIGEIIYDWNEPGKVLRIDVAQDKARQLGLVLRGSWRT